MKKYIWAILISFVFSLGCSSFVKDRDAQWLRGYESRENFGPKFVLLKDIEINREKLMKGTVVRIITVTDSDWLKVYVYKATESALKSKRFLALYLFKSDFPNEKFDKATFERELRKVLLKK